MKRRVASLPPISLAVFNEKVLERRTETAVMSSAQDSSCEVCKLVSVPFSWLFVVTLILLSKTYTTENAYRSHIQSKKHKENELKSSLKQTTLSKDDSAPTSPAVSKATKATPTDVDEQVIKSKDDSASATPAVSKVTKAVAATDEGERVIESIDEKIAAARSRLSTTSCLFCPQVSLSLDDSLTHMSLFHSFFIPDAQFLIDLPGLILYLGEKIAVGNVCIYCNQKGREFRSIEAVRKHMVDKSHCKIAYDLEDDRLELSDYYDFTSSYQDVPPSTKSSNPPGEEDAESWEDMEDDDGEQVDEIADEAETSSDDLPETELSYGDSIYELVLPSGSRIGHRTMRRYYAQSFPGAPRGNKPEDPNSGAALVRRLLADKNSALVPRKGGFGAFGNGTDVVKARNRGEAREAGRHVREFRDQKRREDFKTKVGFIHNSQKHFRDPRMSSMPFLIASHIDDTNSCSATVNLPDFTKLQDSSKKNLLKPYIEFEGIRACISNAKNRRARILIIKVLIQVCRRHYSLFACSDIAGVPPPVY
jgi:pre-60S factor REI1